MLMPRALVLIAMATSAALAIGLPLGWAFLQFHRSSQAPQEYAAQPPAQHTGGPIVGYVIKEPEDIWHRLTDPVAVATFILAAITLAMTRAVFAQVKLGREEFNATHRPEIIVHNFETSRDFNADDEEGVGASFTVVNKGTADALIEKIEGIIVLGVHYLRPGVTLENLNVATHSLASGQQRDNTAIFGKSGNAAEVSFQAVGSTTPTIKLWCIGRITYRDGAGRVRKTGFCRSYDAKRVMWVKEPESDYEYSY